MPRTLHHPVLTHARYQRADHGPDERWQHAGRLLQHTEDAGVLAARTLEERVLDVLVLKSHINETQQHAGLRLAEDYLHGQIEGRQTARYAPVSVAIGGFHRGTEERDAVAEAAYLRWRKAIQSVGPICADAVITVCCLNNYPTPLQLSRLQSGLERLVVWYETKEQST